MLVFSQSFGWAGVRACLVGRGLADYWRIVTATMGVCFVCSTLDNLASTGPPNPSDGRFLGLEFLSPIDAAERGRPQQHGRSRIPISMAWWPFLGGARLRFSTADPLEFKHQRPDRPAPPPPRHGAFARRSRRELLV